MQNAIEVTSLNYKEILEEHIELGPETIQVLIALVKSKIEKTLPPKSCNNTNILFDIDNVISKVKSIAINGKSFTIKQNFIRYKLEEQEKVNSGDRENESYHYGEGKDALELDCNFNFQTSIEDFEKRVEGKTGYKSLLEDSILKKDLDTTMHLLKEIDLLLTTYEGNWKYQNTIDEIRAGLKKYLSGESDNYQFYLSDGGYGRILLDWNDDGTPKIKILSQSLPTTHYIWNLIK